VDASPRFMGQNNRCKPRRGDIRQPSESMSPLQGLRGFLTPLTVGSCPRLHHFAPAGLEDVRQIRWSTALHNVERAGAVRCPRGHS
jgi:hypothetical protein